MLCVGVGRAVVEVEWGMGMVFGGGFTVDSLRLYVGGRSGKDEVTNHWYPNQDADDKYCLR